MTPEQREAVRSNALYLKNLRPVDPSEVADYIEGGLHPAAVRQVLRESAVDIGLVVDEAGCFVPVTDDPVPPSSGPIAAFPDRYARVLVDALTDRYGPEWWTGEAGDRLRATIRELKADYYRGRSVSYDADAAAGYAVYHLPGYYAAIQYVLDDLATAGRLPRTLRVLDVGAGVGGPALGLVDYVPSDALVEYHGVEPSPAADLLEELLAATGQNVHGRIHHSTAEEFDPEGAYDLLLFANVLSELTEPAGLLNRYVDSLAADGSLLLLAPADRETSIGLRRVERELAGDLTVYSPTVRLWPDAQPASQCWSFDVRPDVAVPSFQRRLDDAGGGTGEFVNVDVQFSYAILRADGARRFDVDLEPGRFAPFADTESHVTQRIDCAAVKLSHDLADDGNPLYLVGDGSEQVDHYAVLTRETALNRGLSEADYGELLRFESALVLWNDDEAAYNLVVDDQTVIDRIPA